MDIPSESKKRSGAGLEHANSVRQVVRERAGWLAYGASVVGEKTCVVLEVGVDECGALKSP